MALSVITRNVWVLLGHIQRRAFQQSARCVSQAASKAEPAVEENEAVNPTFVNRNPRNLEQMSLAVKDRGWKTIWPHKEFYHRLVFSRTQHHVTAEVVLQLLSGPSAHLFYQRVGPEERAALYKLCGCVSGCG
ncbi:hypothetical protein NQD34_007622 [Periophthalmus magnuspinnatus]|nr:hypothetical protein NQD34_007622 [Periophthalmus magnuspinnatus]